MIRIINYISGYSKLKIVSASTARFISECAKSGLHIWDIKKSDNITLYVKAYNCDLNNIKVISQKTYSDCEVVNTYGIKCLLHKIILRKFFISGFAIFLVALFLSTSFVTHITISGNQTVSEESILDMLNNNGFKKGMWVYNIDKKQIQKNILKNNNELSWLWIDIKGTCANVTVRERIPKPTISDDSDYSNCVASNDGVIIEVMPRYGKQMVYPGDVVKKGDLLISGISETKTDNIRYIHADGIIMAKTWYSATGEYHHTRCDRYLTGNSKKLYTVNIMGNKLPMSKNNKLFEHYDKTEKTKKLCDFLNLSFTISTYYEIIEENVQIADDEVVNSAVNVLKDELYNMLKSKKDLTVDNITYDYVKNQSGNVQVTVYFECTEDISKYQQINKPDFYTEDIDGKNSDV